MQPSSGTLSLLQGLTEESEFVVWEEITTFIGSLRSAWIFEDEATQKALKAVARDLISKKAHSLGWQFSDSDNVVLQQFKALMFSTAGLAGDETIVKDAQSMFSKFVQGDREAIHPNIRGAVYSIVLQNGGKKEYDAILNEYRTAKDSDERNTALRTLGRATDPASERGVDCPGDLPAPSDPDLVARATAAKAALGSRVFVLGHHYQRDEVIQFADVTGDSFKLAREAAARPDAEFIVFCGVHFMAESADILTKESQQVVLPDLAAGCSMADMAVLGQVETAWDTFTDLGIADQIVPVTYMSEPLSARIRP